MNGWPADSAAHRWLGKTVLASRLLDDMHDLSPWTTFTTGAPEVADARTTPQTGEPGQVVATMMCSRDRSREGRPSLRMRVPSRLAGPGPRNGRGWGSAGVRRAFDGEDWRAFNRLSLWIFPECPGHGVVALELRVHNDGAEQLPAAFGQEGETTVVLTDGEWNHIVWEIGNVARDRVTRLEISCLMSGHEPEAADTLTFDLDQLELQEVEPDYTEGWGVWPGRIAVCHTGYPSGAAKTAVASGLQADAFRVIDEATGETVLAKPIQPVTTPLGAFQQMDFSGVRRQGTYVLAAGDVRTHPFRIDPDPWRGTILKALNFLHTERCGMAIEGVHGACHRDWTVRHGDRRIVINGGWHDAGDLTQGLGNTAEIVYALFSLAERWRGNSADAGLADRLVEEARWGLDWILKTSFRDGYRNQGSVNSRWTDGILGTSDDVTVTARKSPIGSLTASATEAIAARVLKESDPRLAADCLAMAEEDWRFGRDGMAAAKPPGAQPWRVTFDSDHVELELAAAGCQASLELWQATGQPRYADSAIEWAGIMLASQERRRPDWEIPLFGFFYTGPDRQRLLHYCHRGREQGPILALTGLCKAFPDHPDWMKWYSAVAWHAEYLKAAATFTDPWGVMPASIYHVDEARTAPPERQDTFREQVEQGVPLGRGYYLRKFPVWMNYRGHFGTILPQAQALLAAAHLRQDPESALLAQRQAEWIVGRNPFAQSTMYGEGHDFPPLYAPLFGNVVGSLPVGFQTRGNHDVPYWPVQSTWTYKEVWVHPVARWLWLMRDLAGPALIEGRADSPVELLADGDPPGAVHQVVPTQGRFRIMMPEGRYTIRCGGQALTRVLLPAGTCVVDLRPGRETGFAVSKSRSAAGDVRITVNAAGDGAHRFSIRADNLQIDGADQDVVLTPDRTGTVEWRGRIRFPETPWIAVIIADGNLSTRREISGAAWDAQEN